MIEAQHVERTLARLPLDRAIVVGGDEKAARSVFLCATVADRQLGWTDRLPRPWRDFALLARWDRPIGTWLLLLPCWWGLALANQPPDPWLILLFAVGAIAMRGAGCTVNDMADRDFDRMVERTRNRPLAAVMMSGCESWS